MEAKQDMGTEDGLVADETKEETKETTQRKVLGKRPRETDLEILLDCYRKQARDLDEKNFKLVRDVEQLEVSISILNHLVGDRDDEIDKLKDEIRFLEEDKAFYKTKTKHYESMLDRSLEKLKNYEDKVSEDETQRCQVCYYFEKAIILNCGHRELCVGCIKKMAEDDRPNCPICREKVISATVLF